MTPPGIQVIRPADRAAWLDARGRDVTASVVGALFSVHEFVTTFELWAHKTGRLPRMDADSPAMERGRLLEPVAVAILRERHPKWRIVHNAAENVYFRDPAARLGATPDVIVERSERGRGVVQIKSVEASTYRRKWLQEDGQPEAPLWIALQATLEAHLTGATWAAVAPLVIGHGVEMEEIDIPLIPGVVDAMKAKAADFWAMIAEGREPEPDYARDGDVIARMYRGDPEAEADLTGDARIAELVERRARLVREVRAARAEMDAIDAEVMATIGDATVAHIPGGRKVTWRTQRRAGTFVPPFESRVLRFPKGLDDE